jgi:hypothetical protein
VNPKRVRVILRLVERGITLTLPLFHLSTRRHKQDDDNLTTKKHHVSETPYENGQKIDGKDAFVQESLVTNAYRVDKKFSSSSDLLLARQ